MAKSRTLVKSKKASPAKRAVATPKKTSTPKPAPAKKLIPGPLVKGKKRVMFIDSSAFFPSDSASGYTDHFQDGRYTKVKNRELVTPILLPVKARIISLTIYYKNNTSEDMHVFILKKHIDHHAGSGEVEVTIDFCNPGSLAPDDYLAKYIDHFDASGVIQADYLYYLTIGNTLRTSNTNARTLRGIRLEYSLPA